jgi:hypothetical protein
MGTKTIPRYSPYVHEGWVKEQKIPKEYINFNRYEDVVVN